MFRMFRHITRSAFPLALSPVLAVAPLIGQQTGTDSAPADVQGYAPSNEASTSPPEAQPQVTAYSSRAVAMVLPVRSDAAVEQGIRAADQALDRADADLARLLDRRAKTEAAIRSQESQAAELEARKRQADKEKRKGDKAALEAQKKMLARQKALTEQLKALNDAEIDAAKKAVEVALAKQHALELERRLIGKRTERSPLVPDLEQETLVAQKKAAALERDLAGKREFVSSKRLDTYRASREAEKP
jgi:hypothetical protein